MTLFVAITIGLRIGSNSGQSYFIQCRDCSNLSAYNKTSESTATFIYMIIFAFFALGFSFIMSRRTYPIKRQISVVLLSMNLLLLVIAVIVSYLLLSRH